MKIDINKEGKTVTLLIEGKIDTVTAPDLEEAFNQVIPGTELLILDFANVAYLSSAGLRALLNAQKAISKQGKMVIRHVNDIIMDVFDMTGFSSVLNIEA